jgi:hypothetical protein
MERELALSNRADSGEKRKGGLCGRFRGLEHLDGDTAIVDMHRQ